MKKIILITLFIVTTVYGREDASHTCFPNDVPCIPVTLKPKFLRSGKRELRLINTEKVSFLQRKWGPGCEGVTGSNSAVVVKCEPGKRKVTVFHNQTNRKVVINFIISDSVDLYQYKVEGQGDIAPKKSISYKCHPKNLPCLPVMLTTRNNNKYNQMQVKLMAQKGQSWLTRKWGKECFSITGRPGAASVNCKEGFRRIKVIQKKYKKYYRSIIIDFLVSSSKPFDNIPIPKVKQNY